MVPPLARGSTAEELERGARLAEVQERLEEMSAYSAEEKVACPTYLVFFPAFRLAHSISPFLLSCFLPCTLFLAIYPHCFLSLTPSHQL